MAARGRIGLLGLGTVGSGVVAALQGSAQSPLGRASGGPVEVAAVLVREPGRPRGVTIAPELLTTDPNRIIGNPAIDIVVEVLGGEDPAADYVARALEAGQHVVTANKELLAKHGPRLYALARERGVHLRFEASVGGGIPFMAALRGLISANRVTQLRAIINGTTNYILTSMAEYGRGYDESLAAAQSLGYAEPDPTADVEGYDAVYKLAVLATLCFGQDVHPDQIGRQGITGLQAADFQQAAALGHVIKLLAVARRDGGDISASVAPVLVPANDLLAGVSGVFNAIQVDGDLVGRVLLSGRGAGPGPTASAILGDVAAILVGSGGDPLLAPTTGPLAPVVDGRESAFAHYLRVPIDDPSVVGRARPFVEAALGPGGLDKVTAAPRAGGLDLVVVTGQCQPGAPRQPWPRSSRWPRPARRPSCGSSNSRGATAWKGRRTMLVMKFGGTSVGGAAQIASAASIVVAHRERRPVVVVSAITRVTDLLLSTARAASGGDRETVRGNLRRLNELHRAAIDGAIADAAIRAEVSVKVAALLARLRRSCTGIVFLGELSARSLDAVAATGERCSALIVAGVLRDRGLAAEAVSASDVVVTDDHFGAANPLMEPTRARAEAVLRPLVDAGVVPVITGFIGATADGAVTTLGRGGSDYSASIIGGALGAAEIWIWTDVTGVMSADPRIVPDARTLPRLSYAEAAELSYYGAKVIHPRTIIPAVQQRIPIWIKNTFQPAEAGTLIGPGEEPSAHASKAITSIRLTGMITVTGAGLLGGPSIVARVFATVARRNANLFMISQSSSEHNVCFVVGEEVVDLLLSDLQQEFATELAQGDLEAVTVLRGVSVLAVVGAGMRGTPGVAGRVFSALGRHQVNIIAIAQGSSELNISFAVSTADEQRAVRVLHDELVLDRPAVTGRELAPASR